jgi:dolichol-phosphate mannosyltransferase
MIPLLSEGVDLVTASPYHPQGGVKNVPRWRLFLSKSLSRLYRLVLRQKLYTYTSCFRVYRRQTVVKVEVERGGFFGVTELLGRVDLAGGGIVEFPATLEARMLGRSKMKVLRTITGHLGLLMQFVRLRLRGG